MLTDVVDGEAKGIQKTDTGRGDAGIAILVVLSFLANISLNNIIVRFLTINLFQPR